MNVNAPPFVPGGGSPPKAQLSIKVLPRIPIVGSPSKVRLDKDLLAKRTHERFVPPRLQSASSESFRSNPKNLKVAHLHPHTMPEKSVKNNAGGREIKGQPGSSKAAGSNCVPLSNSTAANETHEATRKPSPISRDVSPGTKQLPQWQAHRAIYPAVASPKKMFNDEANVLVECSRYYGPSSVELHPEAFPCDVMPTESNGYEIH